MREVTAVMPAMWAWGVVSGVAMVGAGLSVPLALAMTLCVYSAGAQLGALPLMASHAPLWLIVATAACVNLRFVIFSAGLRPYLMGLPFLRRIMLGYICADLTYVLFMRRFGHDQTPREGPVEYLVGGCVANWISWQAATLVGIFFEKAIPQSLELGYAGVLALLGLSCSLMLERSSVIAGALALVAALLTRGLPLRLNIVVAIAVGVAAGMLFERYDTKAASAPEAGT
jgi:predicted branched-subunit amino acid permease